LSLALEDSITALHYGEKRIPDTADLRENLAVVELLSNQPAATIAAFDCLCNTANRIGHTDLAVHYGRQTLEAKDVMFRGRAKVAAIPEVRPLTD